MKNASVLKTNLFKTFFVSRKLFVFQKIFEMVGNATQNRKNRNWLKANQAVYFVTSFVAHEAWGRKEHTVAKEFRLVKPNLFEV